MELKKTLGKRIRELRIKNNLKQAVLAEKVGIAAKHQSCIETGKNYPSSELIEKYANVLKIDVAEILSIGHIKEHDELLNEINTLLDRASDDEIVVVHKILNGILR